MTYQPPRSDNLPDLPAGGGGGELRGAYSLVEGAGAHAVQEWLGRQLSANTRSAYHYDLGHFLEWMRSTLGHTDPRRVTVAHMGLYLRHRRDAGDSRKTASRRMSTVASLYQHLLVAGAVGINPADYRLVRRPPATRADKPTPWLEAPLLMRVYRQAEQMGPRQDLVCALLGIYGLRSSEVGWLRLGDVQDSPHGCVLRVSGKGGEVHQMELDQITCDTLAEWLRERWVILEDVGQDPEDPGLALMVNIRRPRRGQAMTRKGVTRIVRAVSEKALEAPITPHVLRKSTAMMLHEDGMSSLELREWGRWSSLVTVQTYVEMAEASTQPGLLVREVLAKRAATPVRRTHGGRLVRPTRSTMTRSLNPAKENTHER